MTTIEEHDAEWAAVLAEHFPTVTDNIALLRMHSAYMLGFRAGMKWMRAAASKAIAESISHSVLDKKSP